MKPFRFWAKAISLSALIIAAFVYLCFIGIMNFFTASPNRMDAFYWYSLVLHLAIMLICVLYLINRIRFWSNFK